MASRVELNKQQINAKIKRIASGQVDRRSKAYREFLAIAEQVEVVAKSLAKQRLDQGYATGEYVNSIHIENSIDGRLSVVADAPHSDHIEYGTKTPIVAKSGGLLRIPTNGNARFARQSGKNGALVVPEAIYVKSVKGQPAKHIMEDAARLVASKTGARFNKLKSA